MKYGECLINGNSVKLTAYGYCQVCGQKIYPTKNHPRISYCSSRCRWKAWHLRHRPEWKKDRVCPKCGKIFMPKFDKHYYCSSNCQKYSWALKKYAGVSFPRRIKKFRKCNVYFKHCPECGIIFSTRWLLKIYCSDKCATNYQSKIRRKNMHLNYIKRLLCHNSILSFDDISNNSSLIEYQKVNLTLKRNRKNSGQLNICPACGIREKDKTFDGKLRGYCRNCNKERSRQYRLNIKEGKNLANC